MTEYSEDDYLLLSGIQHFAFCRRQWALIHIEQLWADNVRTVEGNIMHENAHDKFYTEKRGDLLTSRGMPIHSRELGISGECDVVELRACPEGVPIHGRTGTFLPIPVEYKKGKPKADDIDILQLTAQAMCLEEMFCCDVPKGFLYYGEPRKRTEVEFTPELRENVKAMFQEMHDHFRRRYTPRVKRTKSCNACSLKELCLPKLCGNLSAKKYLDDILNDDSPDS